MNPRSRTFAVAVVATAILVAVAGAYLVIVFLPPGVLVPAGTVIDRAVIPSWVVHFAAFSRGRVVGAAAANLTHLVATSPGGWGLGLVNGTPSIIPPPECPRLTTLPSASESFNLSVWPGSYTLFWVYCLTYLPTSITVTRAIQFVP